MSVLTGVHRAEHKVETYLAGVCFCDGFWSKKESAREGLAGCSCCGMCGPAALHSAGLAAALNVTPAETHTVFWCLLNAHCLKHCPSEMHSVQVVLPPPETSGIFMTSTHQVSS